MLPGRPPAQEPDDQRLAVQAFVEELRELRLRAGKPTYRRLSEKTHYGRTVLSQAFSGTRLPSWEVTRALVAALGEDEREWRGRWAAAAGPQFRFPPDRSVLRPAKASRAAVEPRYQPMSRIVKAGQGTLWLARENSTGDRVVLKVLNTSGDASTDDISLRRFAREVRKQSTFTHPGIMPILAHDFSADPPWYVMPFADRSLAERLSSDSAPLTTVELRKIMSSVFDAVESAHEAGIVHRDLKPANILRLRGEGSETRWVVADFGLCRDVQSDSMLLTQTSMALGSFQYMAPEQFSNAHDVGFTADVYALGCILYHCLTGNAPGYRQLDLDGVPASLRPLVEKATAHAKADRYYTVKHLHDAFCAAVDGVIQRNSRE